MSLSNGQCRQIISLIKSDNAMYPDIIDIIKNNMNTLFCYACINIDKEVIEWLYELSKIDGNTKIDIHVDNDFAFKNACHNNSKKVAEWLYELSKIDGNTKIDIHIDNDITFKNTCYRGYKEVAEWLCTIENDYKLKYFGNDLIPIIKSKRSIIELINDNELDINSINLKQIEKQKDDICMICHSINNRYWAKLECITFVSCCPMRCREINMNNIELYDITFV